MDTAPVKITVAGVSGRLGRAIAAEIVRREDTVLSGAMVSSTSLHLGADVGELIGSGYLGVTTIVSLEEACADADVLIDATAPGVTAAIAARLGEAGGPALVSGVTGMDDEQQARIETAAEAIAVLQASNFSLGVAITQHLVAEAARSLSAEAFDLEISETHHRAKADAPSGTALGFGRAAAIARGADFDALANFERPRAGGRRAVGQIGFSSLRGGGVIGEHAARFLASFEEITISHRAFDRQIFARGAVEAALWLNGRPAGLYTMQDVVA